MNTSLLEKKTSLDLPEFLQFLWTHFGYDFREYSMAHLQRRIQHRMNVDGCTSLASFAQNLLLHKEAILPLLDDLSINVTQMFRDPRFFRELRDVLPTLFHASHPIKIWHAGCATGQEAYSMAILLEELGKESQSLIYGTDFHPKILERAREGIFSIQAMREYTENYLASGGTGCFSNYYRAEYGHAVMARRLRESITFSQHNLVTDFAFGEMNAVLCRNVLIYFNKSLQNRVLQRFRDCLAPGGILCLGSKEDLAYSSVASDFVVVSDWARIYRKKG
ncbi:MAG: protein-glutamate O-methyltransferase CheR [Spirochaetales bacterium]|nr:protein-glutamate O-methyltransferase CheR [Spirochaetales bacterium]